MIPGYDILNMVKGNTTTINEFTLAFPHSLDRLCGFFYKEILWEKLH